MIIINIIDPTIFEIGYPDLYEKQFFYFIFLLIIPLIQSILFFISLRRSLFVYLTVGIITFLTSFEYLIHNPSRGPITVQFTLISFGVLLKFLNTNSFISLKKLILFFLFSIYTASSTLLFVAFPYLRGEMQNFANIQNSGFGFMYVLINFRTFTPLIRFEDFFSLYNYDIYSSINAAFYQLLEVIRLIDKNQSIGFKTFFNLVPNIIPSFIYDLFGINHPVFDGTLLKEYMNSLGGFVIHGNLYWNNGVFGLVFGILIISIASFYVDNVLLNAKFFLFSIYFLMLPIYAVQYLYGIQGLARSLEVVAFASLSEKFLLKKNISR